MSAKMIEEAIQAIRQGHNSAAIALLEQVLVQMKAPAKK
jgi:hypothetical protein